MMTLTQTMGDEVDWDGCDGCDGMVERP